MAPNKYNEIYSAPPVIIAHIYSAVLNKKAKIITIVPLTQIKYGTSIIQNIGLQIL